MGNIKYLHMRTENTVCIYKLQVILEIDDCKNDNIKT